MAKGIVIVVHVLGQGAPDSPEPGTAYPRTFVYLDIMPQPALYARSVAIPSPHNHSYYTRTRTIIYDLSGRPSCGVVLSKKILTATEIRGYSLAQVRHHSNPPVAALESQKE